MENKEVEKLVSFLRKLPATKCDLSYEGDSRIIADVIIHEGYIHKFHAVDYCEPCVHCFGGYKSDVGPDDCVECQGKRVVLKQD